MEKLFPEDILTKRERVMRALTHRPVDRVPVHEQLSHNPDVIAHYTGKKFENFNYKLEDIGEAVRKSCDMCFQPYVPKGTDRVTDEDGFVFQDDYWTSWHISRPFSDEHGAAQWIEKKIQQLKDEKFDAEAERCDYNVWYDKMQRVIGETVLCDFSWTGFCEVFDRMGLEIYTFFEIDYPELLMEYYELRLEKELRRVAAIADPQKHPVILIPEDFATKQGPIFHPDFLNKYHFPMVKRLAAEWKKHGTVVLYHSDGNYKRTIPALIACGVDGFYCLEPACGMFAAELANAWPEMAWLGGIDGVELMERGQPEQVREAVRCQIEESGALQRGGLFIATSSEINPPIKCENYLAMVAATNEFRNRDFRR